jgi:hypothetical protein
VELWRWKLAILQKHATPPPWLSAGSSELVGIADLNKTVVLFQWLFQPIQGPGLLFSSVIIFTQTVGRLRGAISLSQGRYLNTGQHKYRINPHTDIHASIWIRTHDPRFQTSEDSSCLRPRKIKELLRVIIRNKFMFAVFVQGWSNRD